MQELEVTRKVALEHGLTDEEFERIKKFWEEFHHSRNLEFSALCGVNTAATKFH